MGTPEIGTTIGLADSADVCPICLGWIKVGEKVAICICKVNYHEQCASKLEKCVKCGTPIEIKAKKLKIISERKPSKPTEQTEPIPQIERDEVRREKRLLAIAVIVIVVCGVLAGIYFSNLFKPAKKNLPPVAAINIDTKEPLYAGDNVIFNATKSYDPDGDFANLSFDWDFGDGKKGIGPVCVHRYASPGNYAVKLTVSDDKNAASTNSTMVRILKAIYQPVTVKTLLETPEQYEGKLVFLKWTQLFKYTIYEGGGVKLFVSDNSTTDGITVYISVNATVPDKIILYEPYEIAGVFAIYKNVWEVKVRAYYEDYAKRIPYSYMQVTVADLLETPEKYNRTYVRIKDAYVDDSYCYWHGFGTVLEDKVKFKVKDKTSDRALWVNVYPAASRPQSLQNGTGVDVQGFFIEVPGKCGHYHNLYYRLRVRAETDDYVMPRGPTWLTDTKTAPCHRVTGSLHSPYNYKPMLLDKLMNFAPAYNNSVVSVQARVVDSHCYRYNTQGKSEERMLITIADDSTSNPSTVLLEQNTQKPAYLGPNDEVVVNGLFHYVPDGFCGHYHGSVEITVRKDTADKVELLKNGFYTDVNVIDLLKTPQKYLNKPVKIRMANVTDNYTYKRYPADAANLNKTASFYVKDYYSPAVIQVYCGGNSNRPLRLAVADVVTLQGVFTAYKNKYEILVRPSYTGDFVKVTDTNGEIYSLCTLATLYKEPQLYENSPVILKNAIAVHKGWYSANISKTANFSVRDMSTAKTIKVFVYEGGSRPASFNISDVFEIKGKFVWYENEKVWEIIVDKNGYVKFNATGAALYSGITLSDFFKAPSHYSRSYVELKNAVVTHIINYPADINQWALFKITDLTKGASLKIYSPPNTATNRPSSLAVLDKVNIKGKIGIYAAEWEIVVDTKNNPEDCIVKVGTGTASDLYSDASISEILSATTYYNWSCVIVKNVVVTEILSYPADFLKSVRFYVRAENGASILVYGEANAERPVSLNAGNKLNLYAQVYFYNATWELKVRDRNTQNCIDKIVSVGESTDVYADVNVAELVAEPYIYGNAYLHLKWVIVIRIEEYGSGASSFYIIDNTTNTNVHAVCEVNSQKPAVLNVTDYIDMKAKFSISKGEYKLVVRAGTADFVRWQV